MVFSSLQELIQKSRTSLHFRTSSSIPHHLLSLTLKHQSKRCPLLQIHSKLISARQVFDPCPTMWNTLLKSYSHGPFPQEAIHLFKHIHGLSIPPSRPSTKTFAFVFALKACARLPWPCIAAQFHGLLAKMGFEFHVYVHTALVNVYVACGSSLDARRAFDEMPDKNVVTWNVVITGFAGRGELGHARLLFERMTCMTCRNVVSWTGLIDGYTRARRPEEAVALFRRMMAEGIGPSEITVLAVIPAVYNLGGLLMGETLHGYCEKKGFLVLDVRVQNSLIDMYAKIGSIRGSWKVFDGMLDRRNLVSWTSIISGFAMHGMAEEAVDLFEEMRIAKIRPNRITFLSVLSACGHGGLVEEGLRFFRSMVYEYCIEPEIKHFGCIIDMLGRAGRLKEAEQMIGGLPVEVNAIVWRTLLGCCSKHGEVVMGERVMKKIMELEREYGGDYVVLSNMLTDVSRFSDAERVRGLLDERNAVKVPGLAF